MQKIILDTNVIVSALISNSVPTQILYKLVLTKSVLLCLSDIKVDVLTDTSDKKFLELAAASSADFLITGNTLDFTLDEFEYTKILTPRAYWELIIRKNELW